MLVAPGNTISPHTLSHRTDIGNEEIACLLTNLAAENMISKVFLLECDNDDEEYQDLFIFNNPLELGNFIRNHDKTCPECGANLNLGNSFIKFSAIAHTIKGVD